MKMDEIIRENTSDSKDSESNVLETVNFEFIQKCSEVVELIIEVTHHIYVQKTFSELLNCVKEVVENISKNEKKRGQ
ncbi:hypothetical protein Avbf_14786 [Armadillidium vulgare]|nr:hypothetical protein Avbf_14786 [Armadillidium vulgare]